MCRYVRAISIKYMKYLRMIKTTEYPLHLCDRSTFLDATIAIKRIACSMKVSPMKSINM